MKSAVESPLESIATQLFRKVQREIFAGIRLPGDQISELHLAREHRVSQATARHVLLLWRTKGW